MRQVLTFLYAMVRKPRFPCFDRDERKRMIITRDSVSDGGKTRNTLIKPAAAARILVRLPHNVYYLSAASRKTALRASVQLPIKSKSMANGAKAARREGGRFAREHQRSEQRDEIVVLGVHTISLPMKSNWHSNWSTGLSFPPRTHLVLNESAINVQSYEHTEYLQQLGAHM